MKKLKEVTEDRVGGVPGNLVLGGITDQTLLRSESNIGRCRSVSLIIHYYLSRPCCHTATHEYVVPKSIPIAGPSPWFAIIVRKEKFKEFGNQNEVDKRRLRLRRHFVTEKLKTWAAISISFC